MCQIHDSFQEPSQMLTHNKTSGSFVMIQKSNDHFKTRYKIENKFIYIQNLLKQEKDSLNFGS